VLDDWAWEQLRKARGAEELTHPRLCELWPLWYLGDGSMSGGGEEEVESWPKLPLELTMDCYVQIPRIESYEAYNNLGEFAATMEDPNLSELLELALDGKEAFGRFKSVLVRYPEECDRWYKFRDRRL